MVLVFCTIALSARPQTPADRIRNFFAGFEQRDWNLIAAQVADGFTFTSPNGDDHIPLSKYKTKCWGSGIKFFKHIEFSKIVVDGNTAFAMYDISTSDNKIVHNVEYYTFSKGKIKSIETFFGTGVHYPGSGIK